MKIHKPKLEYKGGQVILSSTFECLGKENTLWYSFDESYAKFLTTEKVDGFVVGLLPLAMKYGENIYIDSLISEKLYYNLSNYYIPLLKQSIEGLHQIKIIPNKLDDGTAYECAEAIATGYSGGVDSFCVIYEHLIKPEIPDKYKVTHFVFSNVGSHGEYNSIKAKKLFDERYELRKEYVDEVNVPFIKINSNLSDMLMMSFPHTHQMRNASCILMLQKLFSKYIYASSTSYIECKVDKKRGPVSIEPISQNLLSTETLEMILSGSQYLRTEKTQIITRYKATEKHLNVCADENNPNNCSKCFKCLRTLITLDILGKLDAYKDVFDIDIYKEERQKYIYKIIRNSKTKPLEKEIIMLAEQNNYEFNQYQKLFKLIVQLLPAKTLKLDDKNKSL